MSRGILRGRLLGGFVALLSVMAGGTLGYYLLGDGLWNVEQCLYMTVITLTTVGFGEVLPGFNEVEHVRLFTILLIVLGMGVFLYFASTLTAFIIEGDLRRALRLGRMKKRLGKMRDHIIVCGVGSTGRHVARELMATRTPVVAIDIDEDRLEHLNDEYPRRKLSYIVGDATDDEVLAQANLEHARGLVASLANDKDNLYLVVTARQCNADIRIVARGIDLRVFDKLRRAGADTVVSPNHIGGMRMVSEMIRPAAVKFLDVMLRDGDTTMRIEEVVIGKNGFSGQTLGDADLRRKANVSVLAVLAKGDTAFTYNPSADQVLEPGMTLVVLGDAESVIELRRTAIA
jgi:voltage-gated potassium channel